MLSSRMICYHLELMLSSWTKCYHLGWKCYHLELMVSSEDYMLSSGMKRYHLELMLSSGTTCYHLGWNVIIWDTMLSSGAYVIILSQIIMVSSEANVIIWCYHVMLSCGMITHPFFIFPENFTHSFCGKLRWVRQFRPEPSHYSKVLSCFFGGFLLVLNF